jgi:branched-chain amino acid transport system permease protein
MDMSDNPLSSRITDRSKLTKPSIYGGLIVILCLLPIFMKSPYMLHVFILTFIYIIVAVSFRTIAISGQFPLAHAAFMGVGAYLAGMASKWLGWPPWLTIPLAALASAAIGMLIGYPFARLRALYYALGSLFFGVAIVNIVIATKEWTGGWPGLTGIEPLIHNASKTQYYYFFLGLAVICLLALYRFEFSRIGTTLKAIAQSYLVASSVGINEAWNRVFVVGVGCFFAGLAGAAYGHYNLLLSWTSFNFAATLWIVMYVIIGGIRSFSGPIIGTAILIMIPEFARELKEYVPFISAILMIIVIFIMPQGLVSLPQIIKSWFLARRKGERTAHAT